MEIICGGCGKEVDSNEKHDITDCVKHLKAVIEKLRNEIYVLQEFDAIEDEYDEYIDDMETVE